MTATALTFNDAGDFAAVRAAEVFLREAGFSVGIMQAGSPRGILFGDFVIAKWRNLRPADVAALHGTMIGGRDGPVHVVIKATAPAEAHEALRPANVAAELTDPEPAVPALMAAE